MAGIQASLGSRRGEKKSILTRFGILSLQASLSVYIFILGILACNMIKLETHSEVVLPWLCCSTSVDVLKMALWPRWNSYSCCWFPSFWHTDRFPGEKSWTYILGIPCKHIDHLILFPAVWPGLWLVMGQRGTTQKQEVLHNPQSQPWN